MDDRDYCIEQAAVAYAKANRTRIAREIVDTSVFPSCERPHISFMSGPAGAGKTEFAAAFIEDVIEKSEELALDARPSGKFRVLFIDPDSIRESIPGYSGERSPLFQRAASLIVERVFDLAMQRRVSFLLESTFSNESIAARNVERALNAAGIASVFYMHKDPAEAWRYVCDRASVTGRVVPFDAFVKQYIGSRSVASALKNRFGRRLVLSDVQWDSSESNTEYRLNLYDTAEAFDMRYPPQEFSVERVISACSDGGRIDEVSEERIIH